MSAKSCIALAVAAAALCACGGSGTSSPSTGATEYRVVANGGAPTVAEGEALRLSVVHVQADGTATALSSDATVVWSGPPLVTALPVGSTPDQSILPQPGTGATAMWVRNPDHLTDAQLNGVLYVLDKGTEPNPSVAVTATVGGSAAAGVATATIPVTPFPTGSALHGAALYNDDCASCHGAQAQGTSLAPGLDNATDSQGDPNVAADPSWNGPLFAVTPLDNMDNDGVSLALTMPRWLITEAKSGKLLGIQDFADLFAFLQTQTTPSP